MPTDLLNRPLRDLRISLTDRCNLRCRYCMPAEIFGPDFAFMPRREMLDYEEIARLAKIFATFGVKKLRLTGGEPLLRKGVSSLVELLAAIEGIEDIALTTNGTVLARHARALKAAGLHRVTVSLDALSDSVFTAMNGRNIPVAQVLEGIDAAEAEGLGVKVNMVVKKGTNEQEVLPMARYFKDRGMTLRFIEYMDVGNQNGWNLAEVYPSQQILKTIGEEFPLEPIAPAYSGEVAQRYHYTDGTAELGVIASVTQPFCRGCNRARLSANGQLFTCLFASQGHDLKALLRAGADDVSLHQRVSQIWLGRKDRYSEIRTEQSDDGGDKVEMNFIGG